MNNAKEKELKKICDTCRWAGKGDGKILLIGDIVCVNDKSDRIADFVSKTDTCKLWEAEE
jgi:tryptophanase